MQFEWDTITHLSQRQDIEELDWLLCMFTACNPYLESTFPFDQGDYLIVTTYLIDSNTWQEDIDLEAIYALEVLDFISIDVDDRGITLGLLPGLSNILLPRERP